MRTIFTIAFLSICFFSNAQISVNKVSLNSPSVNYIEVWEKYDKVTDKYFAMVDFGQADDLEDEKGTNLLMTHKSGEPMHFNSAMNILNFMYTNGWELVQIKSMNDYESYMLKRKEKSKMAAFKTSTE